MIRIKQKVYIITFNCLNVNYRAAKLHALWNSFNVTLVCCRSGKSEINSNVVAIKRSKNVLSLFKKLGFIKLYNYLNNTIYFPSHLVLFNKPVIRFITREVKKNPDIKHIIITICPPHDISLTGYYLKKRFPQIIWINDLQDFWTKDEYYYNRLSSWKKRKAKALERKILLTADKTVLSNEVAHEYCIRHYHLEKDAATYIYHPFEAFLNDLDRSKAEKMLTAIKKREKVRLAFVGSLFKEPKVPGIYLLRELNKFVIKYNWHLELNIIGSKVPIELFKDKNDKFEINEFEGLTHNEAFDLAGRSDFLVLLLGSTPVSEYIMHGKYPHYLATGVPVLAFAPSGCFIHKSIMKTGAGFFIDINSNMPDSLYDLLVNLDIHALGKRNAKEINKFSLYNFNNSWETLLS